MPKKATARLHAEVSTRIQKKGPQEPLRVTKAELAKILGIHPRNVQRDIKGGYYSPDPDGLFDLAEVKHGRMNRSQTKGGKRTKGSCIASPRTSPLLLPIPTSDEGITLGEAQRRWAFWKAEAARIDVEQKRGELVPMAVVCRTWSELVTTARGRLLLIPDRYPDPDVREQVRTDIIEALRGLAADEPPAIKKSK